MTEEFIIRINCPQEKITAPIRIVYNGVEYGGKRNSLAVEEFSFSGKLGFPPELRLMRSTRKRAEREILE